MRIDKLTISTNTKNTKRLMAAEIYSIPESNGGGIPLSIPVGGGNGMFGNGQTNLMDLFGFAIVASMFPNIFGGRYGNMGGCGMNNDLVMQAVTAQGEASRTAIQTLASSVGQDFNIVNGAVMNVQNMLSNIALQNAVSVPQLINSIQAGNTSLGTQLQQCCCQTQRSIEAKAAADQLAMCQQTQALTDAMNRNYLALDNKIDALESSRKDREITALTAKLAQVESQQFTVGAIQQAVAPVLGQLAAISSEVEAIKRCQPQTVTLPNNQYTAVPTILANAGADFVASYWANRLSGATAGDTTTTTPATAINK